MKTPTMDCPSCKGTGQAPLPPSLATTLERFGAKGRHTASDLHDPNGTVSINAINNRLENLRRLGFLTRERDGRLWRYEKAKPGTEAQTNGTDPAASAKPSRSKAKKKAGGKGAAKAKA